MGVISTSPIRMVSPRDAWFSTGIGGRSSLKTGFRRFRNELFGRPGRAGCSGLGRAEGTPRPEHPDQAQRHGARIAQNKQVDPGTARLSVSAFVFVGRSRRS